MLKFATYLHPHTCFTAKPVTPAMFFGYAFPHYSQIREALAEALGQYPVLPLRQVAYEEYGRVHTEDYLHQLALMAAGQPVDPPPKLSLECSGYEFCLPGYQYGLGGMFEAVEQMKRGNLERAFCFCLGGHHAHRDWGHGYCLLNPLAATARYAQALGLARVLIIDWDIHHGDGTQAIFAHDDTVYCLSIHSVADLYMAKVSSLRAGTTEGGQQVGHGNIPLLHDVFDDAFFAEMNLPGQFYRAEQSLAVFQQALEELPFSPDLILLFAGCDSHKDDCGGGITNWTEPDFETLTRSVLDLARRAGCPVLSVQGGGYKLLVTIATTIRHVAVLVQAD
ncbi:MAG: histone deacetylase [Anaerolineae bacterium]|nr:histone deacetylase [Anaerolineae bacterium]